MASDPQFLLCFYSHISAQSTVSGARPLQMHATLSLLCLSLSLRLVHEYISMIILPLSLNQEEQLLVTVLAKECALMVNICRRLAQEQCGKKN